MLVQRNRLRLLSNFVAIRAIPVLHFEPSPASQAEISYIPQAGGAQIKGVSVLTSTLAVSRFRRGDVWVRALNFVSEVVHTSRQDESIPDEEEQEG